MSPISPASESMQTKTHSPLVEDEIGVDWDVSSVASRERVSEAWDSFEEKHSKARNTTVLEEPRNNSREEKAIININSEKSEALGNLYNNAGVVDPRGKRKENKQIYLN